MTQDLNAQRSSHRAEKPGVLTGRRVRRDLSPAANAQTAEKPGVLTGRRVRASTFAAADCASYKNEDRFPSWP